MSSIPGLPPRGSDASICITKCSQGLELMEGQNLEVCITAVDESLTFWCQLVDSEGLEKMTSRIADMSQAEDLKAIDPECLLPGSWCLALFADDDLWYRAEVMEKEDEQLSVVFVDYGNTSKISVAHVRDMPADLTNTPPLAFLCELDGFDCARGSWSSSACSEFSEVTIDKVLQLTVTRVKKQDKRVSCSVQIQCDGLAINEVMKTWWTHSESENQLEETEQTLSSQTQELATPTKASSQLEDEPRSPHSLEVESEISGDDLQSAESVADAPEKVTETVLTEAPETSSSSAETAAGFKEEEAAGDENHTVAPEEVSAEMTATDALADQDSSSASVASEQQDNSRVVSSPGDICGGSKTTVKKVPRESPTVNRSSTALKQTELELSSVLSAPGPLDEVLDTNSGRKARYQQYLLTVCGSFRYYKILSLPAADSGELHTSTAPSSDKDDMLQEVVSSAQGGRLIAAEPCEPHEEDSEIPNQTAQEAIPEALLPPGPSTAPPTDSEPQALISDLGDLLEEVTSLVGEISLTDVGRDEDQLTPSPDLSLTIDGSFSDSLQQPEE
ncbi:tudor domain-containing 6 [Nelusetta ayraudi]|uniref:tudor domain-containing 6 n=1 Tax=Nelusetta ayraudi TaxID=303726 RepID=UPI003F729605